MPRLHHVNLVRQKMHAEHDLMEWRDKFDLDKSFELFHANAWCQGGYAQLICCVVTTAAGLESLTCSSAAQYEPSACMNLQLNP